MDRHRECGVNAIRMTGLLMRTGEPGPYISPEGGTGRADVTRIRRVAERDRTRGRRGAAVRINRRRARALAGPAAIARTSGERNIDPWAQERHGWNKPAHQNGGHNGDRWATSQGRAGRKAAAFVTVRRSSSSSARQSLRRGAAFSVHSHGDIRPERSK